MGVLSEQIISMKLYLPMLIRFRLRPVIVSDRYYALYVRTFIGILDGK